jgi:DNA repair protein RadC
MNIRLSREQKITILNSRDIFSIMQQILLRENKIRRNQEHFWIIGLNNINKVLFIELVSLGATNRLQVAPPELFRMAIYKLAVKAILVHNHPSGTTKISPADKDFTDRMLKAGNMLNIEVIDHLIITEENYTSFLDQDIIQDLRENGRYELIDKKERTALNDIKVEAEKEKERKEMAKRMKKEGLSIEVIQKITKLKKSEINKL